jgi:hypothetical protein
MKKYSGKLGRTIEKLIAELKDIDAAIADFARLEAESQANGKRSKPAGGSAGAKSETLFEVKRKLRRRKT